MENELRCVQYMVIHNILPTKIKNKLYKMKLKTFPSCDHCSHPTKIYITSCTQECSNVLPPGTKMLGIFYMAIIQHLFQDLNHFVEYPIFLNLVKQCLSLPLSMKSRRRSTEKELGFSFDVPLDQQHDILS